MPFEMRFASLLSYNTRDRTSTPELQNARQLMEKIKQDKIHRDGLPISSQISSFVKRYIDDEMFGFDSIFHSNPVIVPIPGSGITSTNSFWGPSRIARSLVECGVGSESAHLLKRFRAVPKSAFSRPGERPDIDTHMRSLTISERLVAPARIVLVDDVITRGTTMAACCKKISQFYDNSEVVGFAAMRAMTPGYSDFLKPLDPVHGKISLNSQGNTSRVP
tara:strand:+ start:2142 stop:2801 length:660 start_codon:yes stop_codon:yes gene_type:complete